MAKGKMPRPTQFERGVPHVPTTEFFYEECCDCGLVHRVRYEAVDGDGKVIPQAKVRVTYWRHDTFTHEARIKRLRKKQGFARFPA